jgi:hypothetical protein
MEYKRLSRERRAAVIVARRANPKAPSKRSRAAGVSRSIAWKTAGDEVEWISITEKFARFAEQWQPNIIAELDGQEGKLVKDSPRFDARHRTERRQARPARARPARQTRNTDPVAELPTICQEATPMHEARHRPVRCNPHLHSARRVTPLSG